MVYLRKSEKLETLPPTATTTTAAASTTAAATASVRHWARALDGGTGAAALPASHALSAALGSHRFTPAGLHIAEGAWLALTIVGSRRHLRCAWLLLGCRL
jgi:hypothetical protein